MKMAFPLIWIFLLIYPFPVFCSDITALQRMDPHGPQNMDLKNINLTKQTECKSCHTLRQGKIEVKSEIHQICVSCHGKALHSGVLEHIGKDLSRLSIGLKGKVACQSCHRPHRARLAVDKDQGIRLERGDLDKIIGVSPFLKVKKDPLKLQKGLIEKQNTGTFLRRTCTECHRW